MRRLAVLALLAAGCAHAQPVRDAGTCDADLVVGFEGKAADQAGAAQKAAGAKSLRIVKPGEIVTMEYRPDRLTVELDLAGKIKTVRCG